MFRFRTVFLIISILGLWGLQACKSYSVPSTAEIQQVPRLVENPYFASNEDFVYKAQLQIFSKQMSGLVYIKKVSDTSHRIAFTTDFGNKLLDFEISNYHFTPHYLIPDLDKKPLKKVLEEDFRTLLQSVFYPQSAWHTETAQIFMTQNGKIKTYLYFHKQQPILSQIVRTVNNKEKVQYRFQTSSSSLADSIHIFHKDIPLEINLHHLPNTNSD